MLCVNGSACEHEQYALRFVYCDNVAKHVAPDWICMTRVPAIVYVSNARVHCTGVSALRQTHDPWVLRKSCVFEYRLDFSFTGLHHRRFENVAAASRRAWKMPVRSDYLLYIFLLLLLVEAVLITRHVRAFCLPFEFSTLWRARLDRPLLHAESSCNGQSKRSRAVYRAIEHT